MQRHSLEYTLWIHWLTSTPQPWRRWRSCDGLTVLDRIPAEADFSTESRGIFSKTLRAAFYPNAVLRTAVGLRLLTICFLIARPPSFLIAFTYFAPFRQDESLWHNRKYAKFAVAKWREVGKSYQKGRRPSYEKTYRKKTEADGSTQDRIGVECSTESFGKDPSRFSRKVCFCRYPIQNGQPIARPSAPSGLGRARQSVYPKSIFQRMALH
jgi:hypothetical protein